MIASQQGTGSVIRVTRVSWLDTKLCMAVFPPDTPGRFVPLGELGGGG